MGWKLRHPLELHPQNTVLLPFTSNTKKAPKPLKFQDFLGGDEGDRTPYLLNAIQALSQVSYTPVFVTKLIIHRFVLFCNRFCRKTGVR